MRALSTRFIGPAALGVAAVAAASAAHAGRGEVFVSVGVQPASSYYVQPPPVYVQPAPVYVQPRPVYVQPRPVYVQPPPYGYTRQEPWDDRRWQRGPYGDRDGDGIANVYDPDSPRNRRHARLYGPYGDLDRDGIPNIDDRDIDGDGVRNRHDREPHNPYRY